MGEALEKAPPSTLAYTAFAFTSTGITVTIPLAQKVPNSILILEHTKSGQTWDFERFRADSAGEVWVAPFKVLELSGSYQFRYVSKANGISRVLGKEIAAQVSSNDERFIGSTFFQRAGELFDAELYIPYTRKSARLRVRKAFEHAGSVKRLEHLHVKSVKVKKDEFIILGSAFVPGIPSLDLEPFLLLKNEAGEEVLRVPGERKRSMGNQNRYGFPDCDYTNSGFLFNVSKHLFDGDDRLKAPSRLKLSVTLVGANGESYERTPKATPASLDSKVRTIASLGTIGSRNIVSVISAVNSDELFFTHRVEEEILSSFNKFKRALVYKAFNFMRRPQSNTWLLYEFEASAAQDNGLALFEELKRSRADLDVKYIIDRRSPDAIKLKKYGRHVIGKYTLRHYWSLLTARVYVSSQSRYHGYRLAPPKADPIGQVMAKKPFVFLQHGVIALKKISFHRSNPRVASDLFFSSTTLEQDIICREFGYQPHEVPVVGLPRFDRLVDKSNTTNEILVMPTWRKWLQRSNQHSFMSSDFFRNYMTFLKSSDLSSLCERQGLVIKFYLHPMIAKHIGCFTDLPPHVEIVYNGQEPINELMMKAKMLVTDYSSVAWDFMYMKKPVAFFHFDLPMYDQAHGSYFDLKEGLGRSSVKKPAELVALIQSWAAGEKWPEPTVNKFLHTDQNNCNRAIAAIEELLNKSDITSP
ncbi:CDP-glycerol glycerophosphotransferase family protein [Pseudomonas sp. LAIL14HWK12:I7]|uniref:CDP-glycerol glycerophosphotransferase family protein n=1 Tax=Pseudomonas sp. LAIL14HWK12:I7 TaxID=1259801 RepID=UPI0004026665|nr:CDP-glycerol glycerophosphotransferase family protein [Pseudomonas sp. LAIL14HWK12:I7]